MGLVMEERILTVGFHQESGGIVIGSPMTNPMTQEETTIPLFWFPNMENLKGFVFGLVDFINKNQTPIPSAFLKEFGELREDKDAN